MENKYFVPDIEDIRVGYVLEVSRTGPDNGKVWNTRVVTIEDNFKSFVTNGYIPNGYGTPSVRVPYLTKEQIEAEGWKFSSTKNWEGWNITEEIYQKHGWGIRITYVGEKMREIDIRDSLGFDRIKLSDKELENFSINELRYICKLLKING